MFLHPRLRNPIHLVGKHPRNSSFNRYRPDKGRGDFLSDVGVPRVLDAAPSSQKSTVYPKDNLRSAKKQQSSKTRKRKQVLIYRILSHRHLCHSRLLTLFLHQQILPLSRSHLRTQYQRIRLPLLRDEKSRNSR